MIKTRRVARGAISVSEIMQAYRKAFNMPWWSVFFSPGIFRFADAFYREADDALISALLREDLTDKEQYIDEDFDCDDFDFRLMGRFHENPESAAMPIFITWVNTSHGGHAVLSYYLWGEVWIIEPQNDNVFKVPKTWSLTLLCG